MNEYRWVVAEQERITGERGLFDQDSTIRSILSHNIYGVDINQESRLVRMSVRTRVRRIGAVISRLG